MYANDWGIWNALNDMEQLLDQVNRTIGSTRRGTPFLGHSTPPLNVWANEDALVVTGEIPGVDPGSIAISVMGDTLTVSGKRVLASGKGQQPERTEEFNRSIQLPYRVDPDRTEARCSNGVLTIALHRPETEKPRKITVKAA